MAEFTAREKENQQRQNDEIKSRYPDSKNGPSPSGPSGSKYTYLAEPKKLSREPKKLSSKNLDFSSDFSSKNSGFSSNLSSKNSDFSSDLSSKNSDFSDTSLNTSMKLDGENSESTVPVYKIREPRAVKYFNHKGGKRTRKQRRRKSRQTRRRKRKSFFRRL